MDRWESQYSFWASFGVPAYEENSVPDRDEITYPYITFPRVIAGFNGRASVTPSVWTRSASWEQADTLANAILARLGEGGEQIAYSGGTIWVTADPNSFAQGMGDPEDDLIKRHRLLVYYDFH